MKKELADLLVQVFKDISAIEEKTIITEEYGDLSSNDMRILEAIGERGQKSMSEVAGILSITTGTLTITVGNLVKKGYVVRERGELDKRNVFIMLSKKGVLAYLQHKQYHDQLIQAIINEFDKEERELLYHSLKKLVTYFDKLK